jgi:hypothetical protein
LTPLRAALRKEICAFAKAPIIAAISIASLFLTAGCGGGGAHAPTTVTIGGSVSGLIGTVVLQNNAGDNLSVAANGRFTFPTPLKKGDTYAVTILTQPPGPSCVVSNGSGTAIADVTSVSVTCTTDPATVFLPLTAAPNGLFVITSKSIADSPIQITAGNITSLGLVRRYTLSSSGTLSNDSAPESLVYTTVSPAGSGHVWLLDLSGSSTLVPRQLGSLTIPYSTTGTIGGVPIPRPYCAINTILKNLTDPSSAFLVLALPGEGTDCRDVAHAQWFLIHSQDSPDTAPLNLPYISTSTQGDTPPIYTPILPLYRPNGALVGLVTMDKSSNLNFYPDETFTNPVRLLANVQAFWAEQAPPPLSSRANVSTEPGYSYLVVQTPTSAGSVAASVYRVDYSGTISPDLYDAQFPYLDDAVVDSGNVYFVDSTLTLQGWLAFVVQIPSGGGAARILYTPATPAASPGVLIGLSGTHLVFRNATDTPLATSVETLPVGAPATPTTIANYNEIASLFLAGGDIFVSLPHSTRILDDAGTELQPDLADSAFFSILNSLGAPVLQVRNITAVGGSQVYALDPSQPGAPTAVLLKSTNGAPFSLPSYENSAGLTPMTANIGVGETALVSEGPRIGLVYDLAKDVIATVSIPNADVQFIN